MDSTFGDNTMTGDLSSSQHKSGVVSNPAQSPLLSPTTDTEHDGIFQLTKITALL